MGAYVCRFVCLYVGGRGEGGALTDGEFVSLPKHQVSRSEVTMDDLLFLVNVTKCQY